MQFDLPRGMVFPVTGLDVRLDPGPHPFEKGRAEAIAANWRRAKVAKPAMFDGEVMLLSSLGWKDGVLAGRCHLVRYSTFLYWRTLGAGPRAEHAYAHAMLVSSDDLLVAVRMAPHTVPAGRIYFAAGSFEPVDFPDGRADLEANMSREVMEETGLDLGQARAEPGFHALSLPSGTVVFRRYRFAETADRLADRIRTHVAAEAEPEIEGPVVLRPGDDTLPGLAAQMPALVRWHFDGGAPR